ncbi:glutamate racemase [Halopseudomonas nanhaiensis]|uniref:glutamate racemase n=1 Tax=Halopseudomonas nanhaiensis TaxID=2830842 RepID=UPI001CBCACBB|nr:glutamate racemase [Halopseudomonas nanhaiensis]UAW97920.1 glutamate racemase [Halopseudomonas nanhaiensis]
MSNASIGIFDSGVGGLSVLREIERLLPNESLLYVADSGHVPYGEKSADHIRERSRAITGFLLDQGAKAVVVACNTATAAAVAELREQFSVPIVGMEPAVKPAAAATRSGAVGVLATTGTLQSARFAALLDRFAGSVRVYTQPCPGLVELIEAGELSGPRVTAMLREFSAPLIEAGCDTIILGCTHYPFVRPILETVVPEGTSIIDTGAAVARQLAARLAQRDLLSQGPAAQTRFWSSGEPKALEQALPALWRGNAAVLQLSF